MQEVSSDEDSGFPDSEIGNENKDYGLDYIEPQRQRVRPGESDVQEPDAGQGESIQDPFLHPSPHADEKDGREPDEDTE